MFFPFTDKNRILHFTFDLCAGKNELAIISIPSYNVEVSCFMTLLLTAASQTESNRRCSRCSLHSLNTNGSRAFESTLQAPMIRHDTLHSLNRNQHKRTQSHISTHRHTQAHTRTRKHTLMNFCVKSEETFGFWRAHQHIQAHKHNQG